MEKAVHSSQTPDQDPIDIAMGRTIQVLRTSQGLSRRDLAQRASISYSYLSAIENGDKRPSSKILTLIANALRVHTHELMAAAEARAAGAGADGADVVEASETDAFLERLEERQMTRRLARLGYAVPASPPRTELGALEELRTLVAHMDPADVDLLLATARRLARDA
jgi:transcriptional regulator with XRE-family HTH domain